MQINGTLILLYFIEMLPHTVSISIETSEFCATNDIISYVLYPNATHLIQALDLVLMGIIKKAYKEEVQQWLIANLGEVFGKYIFIEVFVKVWDRAAKVEHAIRGFKLSGIYLLNPAKVKMGKLAPSSLYTKQDQLPEIANERFMNEPEGIVEDANVAKIPQPDEAVTPMQPDGNGMKKRDEPQPSTSQVIQDIKEEKHKMSFRVITKYRSFDEERPMKRKFLKMFTFIYNFLL